MQEIGQQYSKDDQVNLNGFLKQARLHQSVFRAKLLDLTFDTYGDIKVAAKNQFILGTLEEEIIKNCYWSKNIVTLMPYLTIINGEKRTQHKTPPNNLVDICVFHYVQNPIKITLR